MKKHRKIVKLLLRSALRLKARVPVARLCNVGGGEKIGEALKETFQNQVSSEEYKWITKIEQLRDKLNSSTTEIGMVDFGARKASLILGNEEISHGTLVRKTIGEVCRGASKDYFWCPLLFKLIRKFKPAVCIELGTCLGISASFQAAGLKLNGLGKLVTLEGADSLAYLAEKNFQILGLNNVKVVMGRFQDTLDEALNAQRHVDYAFIDGHHDEEATLEYLEQIIRV